MRDLGTMSYASETNVASAATVNLGAIKTRQVQITGTTTITSFGTVPNQEFVLRFAGALTLTHSTALSLPGLANIVTAAGDTCIVDSDGSGNWRVLAYQRAALAPDYVTPPGVWTSYTPVVGAAAGTLGATGLLQGRYLRLGKLCFLSLDLSITSVGTASGGITVTLPVNAQNIGLGTGRETNVNGAQLQGFVATNLLYIYNYGNGFPAAANSRLTFSIFYETV